MPETYFVQTHILIADDHPLFRAAMRQALLSVANSHVTEAQNFAEAADALQQNESIDLAFLDLNMPGNQGLAGLSLLRTEFPNVLFVIVSAEENPATIRRAIDLGACGFIPKSSPLSAISDAVTTVLAGEQWLPDTLSSITSNEADSEEREFAKRLAQLTPHQFKVLKMLAEGLLNKQIAYTLDISESTVKQHVSAVLRKLQVINRTQASVMFKQLMGQGE